MKIFKYLPIIILPFLFFACASKNLKYKGNEKAFEEEDSYIMYALDAQQHKKYKLAYQYYKELYDKSEKPEYLQQMFLMLSYTNSNDEIIKLADRYLEEFPNEYALYRYEIAAYLKKNKLQTAKNLALKLLELSHMQRDYLLVSDIYKLENNYTMALKYLESAYIINFDEDVMDKMAVLLYVNLKKKKDAIAQLETHTRMHSCSEKICDRLIGFYSEENNIEGALNVYLRLYKKFKKKSVADKIVEIYAYKKDYVKLRKFLEESSINNELLLKIYVSKKSYVKASKLAMKLYKEKSDIAFLAQSAIYFYEGSKNRDEKVVLKTIKLLKDVLKESREPLYLNYLGYLLIDHNQDIDEGIRLVREALKSNPSSPFYMDSLAWGYYKLGKCQKAYELMLSVEKALGSDDSEVKEHMSKIQECQKKGDKR